MSTIGPALPPHLAAKRKRQQEDINETPITGPSLPRSPSPASSSDGAKKRKIIGPSLPPAPLEEKPDPSPQESQAGDESDSDDSDFGPTPQPASTSSTGAVRSKFDEDPTADIVPAKPQRDEWMLLPPTSGDWTSRVDPTKLRSRKFQSGKSAAAASRGKQGPDTLWTETPEQKLQRLRDEALGKKAPAQLEEGPTTSRANNKAVDEEATRRIEEYNEKHRGQSLYKEHQKTKPREKEDDPSARVFDREKDIAGGMKINTAKRRELLNKASDFGSRFSKGSYL
ncbi:hypothetical protein MMC25_006721 [Agyrium rufum]|nr:hypothetical protein [Agyrium rufum]